jgi:hypothetical protein
MSGYPKPPGGARTIYIHEKLRDGVSRETSSAVWAEAMTVVNGAKVGFELIAKYNFLRVQAWNAYNTKVEQWEARNPGACAARETAAEERVDLKRKRETDTVAEAASAAVADAALQGERLLTAARVASSPSPQVKCEYIENKTKSAKVEKALIDVMVLLVARRDEAEDASSAARADYSAAKQKWDELAPLGRISAAHQAESDEAYRRADNIHSITYLVGDAARCSGQAVEAEETARIWRELDFDGNQVLPDTGRWGVEHTVQDVQRHFLALAKEHREKAGARETEIRATVAGFVAKKRAILALKTRPAPATIHDDITPEGILLAADASEAELALESAQSVYKPLYAACKTATANLDRFRRVQRQKKSE